MTIEERIVRFIANNPGCRFRDLRVELRMGERIVDRALQRVRKKGIVEFKGGWRTKEQP